MEKQRQQSGNIGWIRHYKAAIVAMAFIVLVVGKSLLGFLRRALHSIYIECQLLISHSRLSYLSRLWIIGRRQRLPVEVLGVGYRPRYGDLFWLYFALICLSLAAVTHLYPGGIESLSRQYGLLQPQPVTTWLKTASDSAATAASQQASVRQIRVLHQLDQPVLPHLQQMGVAIKDEVEIAAALSNVVQQRENQPLRTLPMVFQIRQDKTDGASDALPAQWTVQQVTLVLSEDTALLLTPAQNVMGDYTVSSYLDIAVPHQDYFIVQDTVAGLLQSGNRFAVPAPDSLRFASAVQPQIQAADLPEEQQEIVSIPSYIEDMLLLLDRRLGDKGGISPEDAVVALYRRSPEQKVPQFLYVELDTHQTQYRFVYFQPSLDDRGYLYDDGGFGYVPSAWGEPLGSMRISSRFGLRLHPIKKFTQFHKGIDYAAPSGTPIRASKDGIVLHIRYERGGYGHYVRLLHDDGFSSLYAHMQHVHPNLKHGYPVEKGQVIGYVGNTGLSTGPHLHYEVALNGKVINPLVVTKPELRILSPAQRKQARQVLLQRQGRLRQMQKSRFVSASSNR